MATLSRTFITVRTASVLLAAAELVIGSAIIQFALTLPMAWYFHRVTTLSLPANALVIPLAGILLPTAVVAVALSYVSVWLAWIPAHITAYSLDLLTGTVRLFGHFRLSDLRVPTPIARHVLCRCCRFRSGAAAGRAAERPVAAARIGRSRAAAFALVLLPPKPQLRPGVLEITAIDVGQGDSLLIVTPEGKTLLLDSGGLGATSRSDFDVGEEVVSPYLWSRGIRRLDAVAISHAHSDHIGGMRSIIANFRPRELWYGVESPTPDFADSGEDCQRYLAWC